jgi:hypothetical protein
MKYNVSRYREEQLLSKSSQSTDRSGLIVHSEAPVRDEGQTEDERAGGASWSLGCR